MKQLQKDFAAFLAKMAVIGAYEKRDDPSIKSVADAIDKIATAFDMARAMAIGNTGDAQSLLLLVPSAGIVRLAGAYNNPGNTTSGRDYDTPAVADATLGTSAVRVLVARHNSAAAASATPTTRSRLGQPIVNNSSSAATISTVAALAAAFGSNKTGTGSYLGYGLYESIVCNALLTDDQCRKVELYLAGYYGLL